MFLQRRRPQLVERTPRSRVQTPAKRQSETMEERQFNRFMLMICFCWLTGAVTCYLNARLDQETKIKMAELEKGKK